MIATNIHLSHEAQQILIKAAAFKQMSVEDLASEILNEVIPDKLSSIMNKDTETQPKRKPALAGTEPFILMTEKPKHLKFHAGEISFPGGKLDETDSNLLDTALRETREEIGLDVPREKVIGQLKPVTTLNSRFTIIPFVAIMDNISKLTANAEVEKIFEIPLKSCCNSGIKR